MTFEKKFTLLYVTILNNLFLLNMYISIGSKNPVEIERTEW